MAAAQADQTKGNGSEMQKWREPLTEALFNSFFLPRRNILDTYFRSGYLFDPFLFGSFKDPSDPFALWAYTPYSIWPRETVSLSKSRVDWSETDDNIIICADLPGLKNKDVNVSVENGRVLEISGEWKRNADNKEEERSRGQWWKVEYMRRFTLPDIANAEEAQAMMDDGILNIRIPKMKNKNKMIKGEEFKKQAPCHIKVVEVRD